MNEVNFSGSRYPPPPEHHYDPLSIGGAIPTQAIWMFGVFDRGFFIPLRSSFSPSFESCPPYQMAFLTSNEKDYCEDIKFIHDFSKIIITSL